ncbi:hypothetical protein M7I_6942 [Glarea lozoyensis 74030]|uniref:Uncharacterized protein n=1 Tax=Glarea lozoyensis (strain ATCC 74030 / MF5533) TaxID=1104152 RepID=H0EVY5_GLAL7|nr:hypothetical protein M7I_6942 [Glarea lozoyensis 74030]
MSHIPKSCAGVFEVTMTTERHVHFRKSGGCSSSKDRIEANRLAQLNELRKFGVSFKLATPLPDDLHFLKNGGGKQVKGEDDTGGRSFTGTVQEPHVKFGKNCQNLSGREIFLNDVKNTPLPDDLEYICRRRGQPKGTKDNELANIDNGVVLEDAGPSNQTPETVDRETDVAPKSDALIRGEDHITQ